MHIRRVLLPVALFSVALAVLSVSASAASQKSVQLKIGDAVDVLGTRVACFAVRSSGKDGVGCLLWGKDKPLAGSYSVGLAVDGTAVLSKIKADGSSQQIFKRKPAARSRAAKVYRVNVGDVFGLQITSKIALGCKVINVADASAAPVYQGVKVSCYRATAESPLPSSLGVSISDKFAGVFQFDSKGAVSSNGIMRTQPK
ncbi:MAG TPA: hypothetical protein VMT59_05385 [Gaiellaceae bacterium]|nr:hypothetical protein [Gaiellaceae bacterium]